MRKFGVEYYEEGRSIRSIREVPNQSEHIKEDKGVKNVETYSKVSRSSSIKSCEKPKQIVENKSVRSLRRPSIRSQASYNPGMNHSAIPSDHDIMSKDEKFFAINVPKFINTVIPDSENKSDLPNSAPKQPNEEVFSFPAPPPTVEQEHTTEPLSPVPPPLPPKESDQFPKPLLEAPVTPCSLIEDFPAPPPL